MGVICKKEIPVSDIITDSYRNEKDTDVSDLVQSYEELGHFIHDIAVREDGDKYRIVSGRRRLIASKKLGLKKVPVTVVTEDNWFQVMEDENSCRQDMTTSDKVKLADEIAAWEKTKREKLRIEKPEEFAKIKDVRIDEKVGAAVGLKRSNLHKAKAVVKAAEENPNKFGDLVKKMDDTGNIDKAFTELQVRTGEKLPKNQEAVVVDDDGDGSEPVIMEKRKEVYDDFGKEIPEHLRDDFADSNFYARSKIAISQVLKDIKANVNHLPWINDIATITKILNQASEIIWMARPSSVCVYCHGEGKGCKHCRGSGWVPAKSIPELQANGVDLSQFKS